MMIKNLMLGASVASLIFAGACKRDAEEPNTERSTGDEIEDGVEEAAEDTEEAAEEATEDLDDDN